MFFSPKHTFFWHLPENFVSGTGGGAGDKYQVWVLNVDGRDGETTDCEGSGHQWGNDKDKDIDDNNDVDGVDDDDDEVKQSDSEGTGY